MSDILSSCSFLIEGPLGVSRGNGVLAKGGSSTELHQLLKEKRSGLAQLESQRHQVKPGHFDVWEVRAGTFFAYVQVPYAPTERSRLAGATRLMSHTLALVFSGGTVRTTFDAWQVALLIVTYCILWQETTDLSNLSDTVVARIESAMNRPRVLPSQGETWNSTWAEVGVGPEGRIRLDSALGHQDGELTTDPVRDLPLAALAWALGPHLKLQGYFDVQQGLSEIGIAERVVYEPFRRGAPIRASISWDDLFDLGPGDYFVDHGPEAAPQRLRRYYEYLIQHPDRDRAARFCTRLLAIPETDRVKNSYIDLLLDLQGDPRWSQLLPNENLPRLSARLLGAAAVTGTSWRLRC